MHHLIGQSWYALDKDEVVTLFNSDKEEGLGTLDIKN